MQTNNLTVAYFTMEIGLESQMPTYAGGLGMLAADLMRASTDLGLNAACMTIGWEHGYLRQHMHEDGTQDYEQISWNKEDYLKKLEQEITVTIEGREVHVACWQYTLESGENTVPVYFLDTNLESNAPEDRGITSQLYGGDGFLRLKQEVVLGIGGVRMLRALGYEDIGTFHMNEGHAAFLTLELLRERDYSDDAVRKNCAFTTHTPVKAGHDAFPYDMAHQVVGDMLPWHIKDLAGEDCLSMTHLAMHLSHYTCGVSQIHGDVSRDMFPGEEIDAITNGAHHVYWACPEIQKVFDKYIKGWREDPFLLQSNGDKIPDKALWKAHIAAQTKLLDHVKEETGVEMSTDNIVIATARRVVPYKRPELIYTNLQRLVEVCEGKVQIIHAGNAHPSDPFSQGVIQRMVERSKELRGKIQIAYLENYNPDLAKMMVSGADIWLNTPTRLHEASGTSGMKACVNGVLNLSTLDGWWIEGYEQNPEAGWRIGPFAKALGPEEHRTLDAEDVYTQLQFEVIPQYYEQERSTWIARMRGAIGLMGQFSAQRCVQEYIEKVWH